jgi:hypothetical protein
MEEFALSYSPFLDRRTGPIRQRVAELHTAVIELSIKLQKGEMETQTQTSCIAWLPRHTFIILSQIQGHAAALLEDLTFDDIPPESEIIAMDYSLDSMIDTFTDIKELIRTSMDNFRRSNLTIIHGGNSQGQLLRIIQISITNLDVWRRAVVSHECTMEELHKLIQIGMNWSGNLRFRFYCETPDGDKDFLHDKMKLGEINFRGKKELVYEYAKWTVKVIFMSSYQPQKEEKTRFVAGDGSAPPEQVDGPRHFKRLLATQQLILPEMDSGSGKQQTQNEPNFNFANSGFDLEKLNRALYVAFSED